MKRPKRIGIKRIKVEKLFGLYDYDIPQSAHPKNIKRVLILYGDNGSGKTTILRLIFHLLACERREGHKSFVARTKFEKLLVEFGDGHIVVAQRTGQKLLGSFRMDLCKRGKKIATTQFVADAENSIPSGSPTEEENEQFLDALRHLNLTLYLLADDRTVSVTSPTRSQRHMLRRSIPEEGAAAGRWRTFGLGAEERLDPEQISITLLEESMRRLRGWIRNRVMRGSTRGESDVNVIFSDIIQQIAREGKKGPRRKATRREYIIERIDMIERRNRRFSRFGLTPTFNGHTLLDAINQASPNKFKSIHPIILPYLHSFEAKLNALDDIQDVVERFITTINSFLIDKTISFHVRGGFKIESRSKENLSPAMLSSGERHLLLLFSNAVTALDEQSIFIIDEPEISLNVKWQRNLISSLIECSRKGLIQYVFASHSMEILAQHMDKVIKLEQKRD